MPSEITGIHQSDVIIRSAIIAAIEDLRANPWLLDRVFASLPKDDLTKSDYGQAEVDAAKKWFLSTRIPVFMSTRIDEPVFPCISITLVESVEDSTTLSDTHYVEHEDDDRTWPALSEFFDPISYDQVSGKMVIPTEIGDNLVIAPGMLLVTRTGASYQVVSVDDPYTLYLAPGTVADFNGVVFRGQKPSGIIHLESVVMKETYSIGAHVQGEQTHLTYLFSILNFCLLRYKASLMEARGFERTQLSGSDFRRNDMFEMELVFSRHIQISGYVRQVWPGVMAPKVTSLTVQPLIVSDSGNLPPDTDPDDASWIGDQDALTVKL